jgi:hypothetical protein
VFVTTDDQLLALGRRHAEVLRVRVLDVVNLCMKVLR